jgi:opacity protein-like surface antigen
MKFVSLAGVASAVLAVALAAPAPATAADLGAGRGSMKDYGGPMPVVSQGSAGPCYFRGDVGYSWSNDPTVKWPVNNGVFTGDANANGVVDANEIASVFLTDKVANASMENTWLAEGGLGCSFGGSRGVRVEAVLGFRGERKIDGEPGFYQPGPAVGSPVGGPIPDPIVDPLHTKLQTTTLMFNVYKDFGNFRGFTPYVGAGIGAAYHRLDDVSFTGNPALLNRIHGDNDLAFAWSLMAGVGYQISDRAILDFGYRYIDMGSISSQRSDTGGFVNPAVHFDDLTAHEIKVGLRYHFGGGCCDTGGYQPLK